MIDMQGKKYVGEKILKGFIPPFDDSYKKELKDKVRGIVCENGISEFVWFDFDDGDYWMPKEEYLLLQPVLAKLPEKIIHRIIPGTVNPYKPNTLIAESYEKGYEVFCEICK